MASENSSCSLGNTTAHKGWLQEKALYQLQHGFLSFFFEAGFHYVALVGLELCVN